MASAVTDGQGWWMRKIEMRTLSHRATLGESGELTTRIWDRMLGWWERLRCGHPLPAPPHRRLLLLHVQPLLLAAWQPPSSVPFGSAHVRMRQRARCSSQEDEHPTKTTEEDVLARGLPAAPAWCARSASCQLAGLEPLVLVPPSAAALRRLRPPLPLSSRWKVERVRAGCACRLSAMSRRRLGDAPLVDDAAPPTLQWKERLELCGQGAVLAADVAEM